MKVTSVLTGAALVLGVSAFSDTAAVEASHKFLDARYIETASRVSESIREFSESVCASGDQLVVLRADVPVSVSETPGRVTVYYDSPESVDFEYGPSCSVHYIKADEEVPAGPGVVIKDFGQQEFRYSHYRDAHKYVMVQNLPTFENGRVQGFKEYVEDHLEALKERMHSKRAHDVEGDYLEAISELEEEFRAAESFIAHEGESYVTALESPKASATSGPATDAPHKVANPNLFTNYQFFTPGILSCAIVSFALIGILYSALSWITSLEISYHAFEKQVDYEKKNE